MPSRHERVERIQSLSASERQWQPTAEEWLKAQDAAHQASRTVLDRQAIAWDDPHELRRWSERLGCTEEQLRAAVAAVGNSAGAVRALLLSHWSSRSP